MYYNHFANMFVEDRFKSLRHDLKLNVNFGYWSESFSNNTSNYLNTAVSLTTLLPELFEAYIEVERNQNLFKEQRNTSK